MFFELRLEVGFLKWHRLKYLTRSAPNSGTLTSLESHLPSNECNQNKRFKRSKGFKQYYQRCYTFRPFESLIASVPNGLSMLTYSYNLIHIWKTVFTCFFLNFAFIRYVIAFLKINILVIESAEWTVSSCKYVVGNFSKKLVVVSAFRDIAKYINIDPNQIAYP